MTQHSHFIFNHFFFTCFVWEILNVEVAVDSMYGKLVPSILNNTGGSLVAHYSPIDHLSSLDIFL